MIPESEWKWYGHAGHFICGDRCRFHMLTIVGDYYISTVGEYADNPCSGKFSPLGPFSDDLYETFVFNYAKRKTCDEAPCTCPQPDTWDGIDGTRSATRRQACAVHMAKCMEYAKKGGAE